MQALGRAFEIAFAAHLGQADKVGDPYIAHVVRVAARVKGHVAQVVAILHDVVEDTDVTLEDLEKKFAPEVVAAVAAMTHRKGESYDDYMARVVQNDLARAVKRSDLVDNSNPARLARVAPEQRARLEQKYAVAREVLG